MSRELRRVPLDFAWPLHEVWGGYLNPYSRQRAKCTDCGGTGYAPRARLFAAQWYGNAPFDPIEYGATPLTIDHPGVQAFAARNGERDGQRIFDHWRGQWSHHLIQADVDALVADGRLWSFTRRPRTAEQADRLDGHWMSESNGYVPTADEVNSWSLDGMGHDSFNQYTCVRARCVREGAPITCAVCDDSGDMWPSEDVRKQHDDWTHTEPPTGDGYQLWETTSEGSPISPVFASLDALCEYAAKHCSTFGMSNHVSKERWREMLDDGHVYHQEGNMVFL